METSGLIVRAAPDVVTAGLEKWARSKGIQGALFRTSGSTGKAKWVHLSHKAMRASADSVNTFLKIRFDDVLLRVLPDYHVGGAMIDLRASRAGAELRIIKERWDVLRFMQALEGVTVTSLVPTQLVDIVNAQCVAPDSLRAVLVGGGFLDEDVYRKSRNLSWPVFRTYGMTESCSQIATESEAGKNGWLNILPEWEARTDEGGRLWLKGPALFSGYVKEVGDSYEYEPVSGWFQTSDRVQLADGCLKYKGRTDRVVKILGELVDLQALEKSIFSSDEMMLMDLPDRRAGKRLLALGKEECVLRSDLQRWNDSAPGYMRVKSYMIIDDFPRSVLGKVDRQALIKLMEHYDEMSM